jgi:hypothetical protein
MDIELILEKLAAHIWLDQGGKLRIDKDAPPELKQLAREHKQELIDVRRALDLMNRTGIRIIRLPLGQLALAYPPRTDLDEIRWAARVLRMDSLPLVINDEGLRWLPYREWVRQQVLDFSKPLCDPAELGRWRRQREAEEQARLSRRRRTA